MVFKDLSCELSLPISYFIVLNKLFGLKLKKTLVEFGGRKLMRITGFLGGFCVAGIE
jgi:hypothetical protein